MSRSAQIRRLLLEAPSTCDEIAALLNLTAREAWVGVWVLTSQGRARKSGAVKPHEHKGRPHQIYELTERGRRLAR
jgi:predicted ArsR family transcriptional regulator